MPVQLHIQSELIVTLGRLARRATLVSVGYEAMPLPGMRISSMSYAAHAGHCAGSHTGSSAEQLCLRLIDTCDIINVSNRSCSRC